MLNLRFLFRYAIIFTALTVSAHAKAEVTTMADSLPDRWQYVSEYIQSLPSDDRWWNNLNDPLLDSLITLRNRPQLQSSGRHPPYRRREARHKSG